MTPVVYVGILLFLAFVLATFGSDIVIRLYNSFGLPGLLVGVFCVSFFTIGIFRYWYHRKARLTLLRTLRALNPEQQKKLLQKFTPRIRSELVHQLDKTKNTA